MKTKETIKPENIEALPPDCHLASCTPDPDSIDEYLLRDYGYLYCIVNMDTGELYSYTKRKDKTPVFCSGMSDRVGEKLYENENSAIRAAERLLKADEKLRLCITYYGLALHIIIQSGLEYIDKKRRSKRNELTLP